MTKTTSGQSMRPPHTGAAVIATRGLSEVVREARGGNVAAWNAIVDAFADLVWAIARRHRLSTSDSADVSQTTWLRLVEHLDRIEHPERIGGWLATTARNESLRVLRLSGRHVPAENGNFDLRHAESADVDQAILIEERDRELWQLFSRLPPRCQLLLSVLNAESQLSYDEIGQILGMAVGSIGPTRGRCLERLRRLAANRDIHTNSGSS